MGCRRNSSHLQQPIALAQASRLTKRTTRLVIENRGLCRTRESRGPSTIIQVLTLRCRGKKRGPLSGPLCIHAHASNADPPRGVALTHTLTPLDTHTFDIDIFSGHSTALSSGIRRFRSATTYEERKLLVANNIFSAICRLAKRRTKTPGMLTPYDSLSPLDCGRTPTLKHQKLNEITAFSRKHARVRRADFTNRIGGS